MKHLKQSLRLILRTVAAPTAPKRREIWWTTIGFHHLPVALEPDQLEVGSIIDDIDNMTVLNATADELYIFDKPDYTPGRFFSIGLSSGVNTSTYLRNGRGRKDIHKTPRMYHAMVDDVTAEDCAAAVAASPTVQAWLAAHHYRAPVYIVTVLKLAEAPSAAAEGETGPHEEPSTHAVLEWIEGEEPTRTVTNIDGKLFAVRLTKIYYKTSLFAPPKLCCEKYHGVSHISDILSVSLRI